MIKRVLIANRSEIACRIIRACKESGIESVAVYSDADKDSLHRRLADYSEYIGESLPSESYLNFDKIINAAIKSGADAIHPGYGFLSEKHEFNQAVNDAGLIFIGPNPKSMRLLGSKVQSRITMLDAGIPLVPGCLIESLTDDEIQRKAGEIGYPILIKASDGGGGKGIRIVKTENELKNAVQSAKSEAHSAFGSDLVYIEKFIESPRHIEFQVAADNYGNVIHLMERECSIQRRHQKIIEETPSTALTPELRNLMGQTAVNVIKAANYNNVGTVEFLLDKDSKFYFLEVNTRIQVEHPITEMTTGIDLVKLQLQIANGNKLPFSQEDIKQNGHAIECRIYAEDPENNYMPSSGKIHFLQEPKGPGVRYDCGISQGSDVTIYYDPILAKLITWGFNRTECIERMLLALNENVILGVKTPNDFLRKVLLHYDFQTGNTFTDFLDNNNLKSESSEEVIDIALLGAELYSYFQTPTISQTTKHAEYNPWLSIGNWEICKGRI